ncbi:hypothetical protein HK101_005992, partial [Irineochytrium annulatum]
MREGAQPGSEDDAIEVLSLSDPLLRLMMDGGEDEAGSRRAPSAVPSRRGSTQQLPRSTVAILETLSGILQSAGAREWMLSEVGGGQTVIAGRTISWSATEMVTSPTVGFGLMNAGVTRRSFFLQGLMLEASHGTGADRDDLMTYGIGGKGIGDVIAAFPWQEQAPELGPLLGWPRALKK